jgi:hypothetical protein
MLALTDCHGWQIAFWNNQPNALESLLGKGSTMNRRMIFTRPALASAASANLTGWLACVLAAVFASALHAGTYDPQIGQPGSLGIADTSSAFVEWASTVDALSRGPEDITNPGLGLATAGVASNALGSPVGQSTRVVSLGDGGSITVGFSTPIANGPGADFAVFENGFLSGGPGLAYLELGLVAVSSDGTDFFTFPAVSETQTTTQVTAFGLLDATNLYDLAGKYISGYGTGLDPAAWAKQGWIDCLTVSPYSGTRYDLPIKPWKELIQNVPIYGCADSAGPAENYRLAAQNFRKAGADGIYLFNFFTPREVYVEPPYEVLKDLGDPFTAGNKQ